MRINSISNTTNQNFGQVKIAPDAKELIAKTAKKASNGEWVKILTDINQATERLKNTKWGDVIVDIKNNDYNRPACLVFLTALSKPVLDGMEIVKKEIRGKAGYSNTRIRETKNGQVSQGTGISVTPYDSLGQAVDVVEKNEQSSNNTEKTLLKQIEEQKRAERKAEEKRLQELKEAQERKLQSEREAQERELRAEEERKANNSRISSLLDKLGF